MNGLPVRLPAMTELSMTSRNGVVSRTISRYSNCHEYKGESKLIFEEAADEQSSPASQPPETFRLPAGIDVTARLDEAVDLMQAARGRPTRHDGY